MWLFFHRGITLLCPLLNLIRFLFLQPVEVPPDGSMVLWHIATNLFFVEKFQGHILPRSLMKTFSRTGSSIDPWDTVLVTHLQPDSLLLITTLWAWPFIPVFNPCCCLLVQTIHHKLHSVHFMELGVWKALLKCWWTVSTALFLHTRTIISF